MAASNTVATVAPDRVNLVDKYEARRGLFALLEHVADTACTDTDKHLNEIRAADRKEWDICFACDCARQQRLASARRADQQNAFWNATAELLKLFRVAQKLDQFLHFIFCFFDSGDVAKRDLVLVSREHARFRFAEIKRAFSGHADLLAKQEIEHEQEQGYWQKAHHGLREHVRFRLDRGLNAGVGKLFLQIICEIWIDRGSKRHRLRRRRAHSLADVRAAQCLRRPAILYHQLERIIFVVSNLLVFQQLEKTIIRHVFNRLHSSPVKEHRHRNQTESDHDENNAAPIKIGFAPARFIFLLRVAIELRHKTVNG